MCMFNKLPVIQLLYEAEISHNCLTAVYVDLIIVIGFKNYRFYNSIFSRKWNTEIIFILGPKYKVWN